MKYNIIFLILSIIIFAGIVYAGNPLYAKIAGGGWNNSCTWSSVSSGGADCAGVPTFINGTIFNVTSGAVICNITNCTTNNLTMSNGNNLTIVQGNNLQVNGSIIINNGATLIGNATSRISTWMTNGGAANLAIGNTVANWTGEYLMYTNSTNALTVTISNFSWTVGRFIIQNNNTGALTLNSLNLTVTNGLKPWGDGTGTTILRIAGGHLEATDFNSTHRFDYPITFVSGSSIIDDKFEIGGATARNFNYENGNVSMASNASLFVGGGINWNLPNTNQVPICNLIMINSGTITFVNHYSLQPYCYLGGAGSLTFVGGFTLTVGDILGSGSITAALATSKIAIRGGNATNHSLWTRSGSGVHQISVDVGNYTDIDPTNTGVSWGNTGEVLTIADNCTSNTTFTIFPSAATIDTAKITWNNLYLGGSGGQTITLQSNLNVANNMTVGVGLNEAFTGNFDVSTGWLIDSQGASASNSITMTAGRTLTIGLSQHAVRKYVENQQHHQIEPPEQLKMF